MYVKTNWIDVPDPELATTEPKLNALNLNKIEQGIFDSAEKSALDVANRKIKALFDLTQGQAWDFDRDDNNLYRVPVPSGAKLATVQKYGGKSLAFNQLVQNGNFANTSNWSTTDSTLSVNNNIASITATSQWGRISSQFIHIISGHKYYVQAEVYGTTDNYIDTGMSVAEGVGNKYLTTNNTWELVSFIVTSIANQDKKISVGDRRTSGWTEFKAKNVMLIDLTQMFGAGNEPTTVAEVKALLPNDYYEYNTGEVIHASVDKVVEQGRNLFDIPINCHISGNASEGFTLVSNPNSKSYICKIPINTDITIKVYEGGNRARIALFKNEPYIGMDYTTDVYDYGSPVDLHFPYIKTINSGDYEWVALTLATNDQQATTFKAQCEIGSTATPFAPYRHNEHPIPQAIQSLDGYGWSAGSVYNEVDFERKKFIKRVGRVDLGSGNWAIGTSQTTQYFWSDVAVNECKANADNEMPNIICAKYITMTPSQEWATTGSGVITINRYGRIQIKDSNYSDPTAFKTAMNGVYLYYELATPVETDISDILEPFNVEDGGTITFHNSNGDGYGIPVPSTEEYLVKLEEVG